MAVASEEGETGVSIASPRTSVILFDAACPLCTRGAQFIVRHDTKRRFKFAALQSPAGMTFADEAGVPEASAAGASLALRSGDAWLRESDAALEIASQLRWPLSMLAYLRVLPSGLRDGVYRFVAKHRRRSPTGCITGHELDARTVQGGTAERDDPAA